MEYKSEVQWYWPETALAIFKHKFSVKKLIQSIIVQTDGKKITCQWHF